MTDTGGDTGGDAGDGRPRVELGAVQETLFSPLASRARETAKRRPLLRDPKAVEMLAAIDYPAGKYDPGRASAVTVMRTAIIDTWVRAFLAEHPAGTVVEIGTGLNTRFDRVDNGTVHWLDLDLPDTIELRRRFFADTGRRRMLAASVTDEQWRAEAARSPGPYFLIAEGVLAYLPEDEVTRVLTGIVRHFPDTLVAFDTCPRSLLEMQHKQAARRGYEARWAWACDDPRTLEPLGLRALDVATITRPPRALRAGLPARYRVLLPLADRLLGNLISVTLFRTAGGR